MQQCPFCLGKLIVKAIVIYIDGKAIETYGLVCSQCGELLDIFI